MIEKLQTKRDSLINDMREQKLFKEPLLKKKALLLMQLKEVSKSIKKHDRTILYLANELQEMRDNE